MTPSPASSDVSTKSRVAAPGEGISQDELQLAARNHGLPLEALRYDVTPPGLHYLLTHYDMPLLDRDTWSLSVSGRVDHPYALDFAELSALPHRTVTVTLECAGNGRARYEPRPQSQPWLVEAVGTAEWTGVPLRLLLERAGLAADAVDVVCTGADHGIERGVEQDYARALSVSDALADDVLVADAMNGQPLPPQHGHPVRLVAPGWYGMAHVKWLVGIEVVAEPFEGFQHHAYRLRADADDPGEPVTRIEPRALLVPPGFPDFMSRARVVRPGGYEIEGRAWSGWAPVTRVELSTDDGATWVDAELGPEPAHPYAWRHWRAGWDAATGEHVLSARATDASGRAQPVAAEWNRGGFANNSVQRVRVVCVEHSADQ